MFQLKKRTLIFLCIVIYLLFFGCTKPISNINNKSNLKAKNNSVQVAPIQEKREYITDENADALFKELYQITHIEKHEVYKILV